MYSKSPADSSEDAENKRKKGGLSIKYVHVHAIELIFRVGLGFADYLLSSEG